MGDEKFPEAFIIASDVLSPGRIMSEDWITNLIKSGNNSCPHCKEWELLFWAMRDSAFIKDKQKVGE